MKTKLGSAKMPNGTQTHPVAHQSEPLKVGFMLREFERSLGMLKRDGDKTGLQLAQNLKDAVDMDYPLGVSWEPFIRLNPGMNKERVVSKPVGSAYLEFNAYCYQYLMRKQEQLKE